MKFKEYDSVSALVDSLPNSDEVRKHMDEISSDATMTYKMYKKAALAKNPELRKEYEALTHLYSIVDVSCRPLNDVVE